MKKKECKELRKKVHQYMQEAEKERQVVIDMPNFGMQTIAVNTMDDFLARPLLKRLGIAWKIVFKIKDKE